MNESGVHVEVLELNNKNGKIDTSSIRPSANLLVRQKNQFQFNDVSGSDSWKLYIMNWKELKKMTMI